MAKVIKANNEVTEVAPKNGNDFSLEELQGFVGGNIEIIPVGENGLMVLNEEGKLNGLPFNALATAMTRDELAEDDVIVGNVLVCDRGQIE